MALVGSKEQLDVELQTYCERCSVWTASSRLIGNGLLHADSFQPVQLMGD